jgi:hypothetical protein
MQQRVRTELEGNTFAVLYERPKRRVEAGRAILSDDIIVHIMVYCVNILRL